jgi:hypothetical protein
VGLFEVRAIGDGVGEKQFDDLEECFEPYPVAKRRQPRLGVRDRRRRDGTARLRLASAG